MFKFVALCGLVAVASAGLVPLAHHGYGNDGHDEHHAPAHYEFSYSVHDPHTGDVKEQTEKRDGHSVSGHYSLVEPDGHRRIVHYTADEHNGFNAQVTREGDNQHIQHQGHSGHGLGHVAKVVIAPVAVAHHAPVAIAHHAPIAHQGLSAYSTGHGFNNGYSNGNHGYSNANHGYSNAGHGGHATSHSSITQHNTHQSHY